jgi:O-acetyl-ADP-ribose deacetylase (regulator of RNase III)
MIHYINGDATVPKVKPAIIVHVCNNVGGWGAGFVLAISKKWISPEIAYRQLYQTKGLTLGHVQFIGVETDIFIGNMIAQNNIRRKGDVASKVYIDYIALDRALKKVAEFAINNNLTVHMPRIGCGLAGGTWDKVESIIERQLSNLDVYVYDFN